MVAINASREVSAPPDRVWDIIADVDNEPMYWHGTKSVKNINKNGNVIEREVIISFKNSKCRQTVTLNPKKSVEVKITDGPMKGTKTITLVPNRENTTIDVAWDIRLSGFLGIFTGMVKKHIAEGSEEALDRIAKAVE
jgi:carbon monoxide dehydrogenase subunit G